jgi:hypothetical protein
MPVAALDQPFGREAAGSAGGGDTVSVAPLRGMCEAPARTRSSCAVNTSAQTGVGEGKRRQKGTEMATGETGFDDVTFNLISLQYHSLKAGHDYGQYVRDAENAGKQNIADFFRQVMDQDSDRAHKCHDFLAELGGTDNTSPQPG